MDGFDGDEVDSSLVDFLFDGEEAVEAPCLVEGGSCSCGSAVTGKDPTQIRVVLETVGDLSFVLFSSLGQHEDAYSGTLGGFDDSRIALSADGEVDAVDKDFAFRVGSGNGTRGSEDLDEDSSSIGGGNEVGGGDFSPGSVSSGEAVEANIGAVDSDVGGIKPLKAVLLDIADSGADLFGAEGEGVAFSSGDEASHICEVLLDFCLVW